MFKRVMSTYGAAEAEEVSGVSQALQRHWRRRGLMLEQKGPGRVRYSTFEVVYLTAMHAFSQSGVSVKTQKSLAVRIAVEATEILEQLPGAAAFTGPNESAIGYWRRTWEAEKSSGARFLIAPFPSEDPDNDEFSNFYARGNLLGVEELIAEKDTFCAFIVDAEALARIVHKRIRLPVVTIEGRAGTE